MSGRQDDVVNTIVIVDDDAQFRAQAAAVLAADGFVVVGVAIDGASGIEAVRAHRPDCALIDIGLPDLDGFGVANTLAFDDPMPAIVLTSSRDAAAYGPRLLSGPWLGFIPKDELSGPAIRALRSEV